MSHFIRLPQLFVSFENDECWNKNDISKIGAVGYLLMLHINIIKKIFLNLIRGVLELERKRGNIL